LAEDVIANIRLLDQLHVLAWLQSELYHYFIRKGSLAHSAESGARFDRAYAGFLNRLEHGDGFGLSQKSRPLAITGLTRKRALNTAFEAARQTDPDLTFQAFMAQLAPA
jgi:hypothetical protein